MIIHCSIVSHRKHWKWSVFISGRLVKYIMMHLCKAMIYREYKRVRKLFVF